MFTKILILAILLLNFSQSEAFVSCNYTDPWQGYTCQLTVVNPDGFDNFTTINGSHMSGRMNMDVRQVINTNLTLTTNIPRIICDSFRFLDQLTIMKNVILEINSESLAGCTMLTGLNVGDNKILQIAPNAFNSNRFLKQINMDSNYLQELPVHVFRQLAYLENLSIRQNFLLVINSDIFGTSPPPALKYIYLGSNMIYAVSPVILNIGYIDFSNNLCASGVFTNKTQEEMTKLFKVCLDNYAGLSPNPTPPPDGCSQRNVFDRVCDLEESSEQQRGLMLELTRRVDELTRRINDLF